MQEATNRGQALQLCGIQLADLIMCIHVLAGVTGWCTVVGDRRCPQYQCRIQTNLTWLMSNTTSTLTTCSLAIQLQGLHFKSHSHNYAVRPIIRYIGRYICRIPHHPRFLQTFPLVNCVTNGQHVIKWDGECILEGLWYIFYRTDDTLCWHPCAGHSRRWYHI